MFNIVCIYVCAGVCVCVYLSMCTCVNGIVSSSQAFLKDLEKRLRIATREVKWYT